MKHETLELFFERYQSNSKIQALRHSIKKLKDTDTQKLVELYSTAIECIEDCIWESPVSESTFADYQALFHDYETLIHSNESNDTRFKFIISIPVADRPQHLSACLNSILSLCKNFKYGGISNGMYQKVCVLICDDSKYPDNIKKHRKISQYFTQQGIECIYFGNKEQKEIISSLSNERIENITGNIDPDNFVHKGASITRNISYLKLQQLQDKNQPCLFYFIDSDQEFKINIPTPNGSQSYYAINYFYQLNKIFSHNHISILTGKVVGDPPVSPAVMAGTFIDDVINFTQNISKLSPEQPCQFHHKQKAGINDAAYHDMADLFGFDTPSRPYDYHCGLTQPHNHIDCLNNFSGTLNHFFDGEHPTRKSYYQHENLANSINPARTIYTGNYIFKPENLKYFIPFANLKLRMAGPVLGRIIKSEQGDNFASANLPMLHNRTVDTTGQSEFRAGVIHNKTHVDLSEEFTRQFFGDVMLFSIAELTDSGFPEKSLTIDGIFNVVQKTFLSLKKRYIEKKIILTKKNNKLKKILNQPGAWWNESSELLPAIKNFSHFVQNIENNFGENAKIYTLINTQTSTEKYLQDISSAISTYKNDRAYWQSILSDREGRS